MSSNVAESRDGDADEKTGEIRDAKRRRLEQKALFAYFNSTGAWPTNFPDEVVQNIVSYTTFTDRQRLRLTSRQFQHSIDSMRWPKLELNFNHEYWNYSKPPWTHWHFRAKNIVIMDITDYKRFLTLNLRAPRPTRLVIQLHGGCRGAQQALAIMQHLAANMSDSVTELEVLGLQCDETSYAAMCEAFSRFTSVTSLILSSRSSPSFVMSLAAAFQSLVSLTLTWRPSKPEWREGIDEFSGSKLSFLPSTLTDMKLLLNDWPHAPGLTAAKYSIFLESIMAGLSENTGLKRLSSDDLFNYRLIRSLKKSELQLLHQSFAKMLSRLVNLEELLFMGVPNMDSNFWPNTMSWFDSSNSQGSNARKVALSLYSNAPLEAFETVASACNRLFPRLEELFIGKLCYNDDYDSQSVPLYNGDDDFDVETLIDHVVRGFSSLTDHPTLSRLVFHIDEHSMDLVQQDCDLFISGLQTKLGGKIRVTEV